MALAATILLPWLLLGCDAGSRGDGPNNRPDAALGPDGAAPPADAGPPVSIEYLDPDHGAFAGGTEVLLRGHGFVEGMKVSFGGRQVEPLDLQVVDARRALLKTPPGSPGPATVEVDAPDGHASVPDAYRYEAVFCDPPTGSIAGGTYVRVKGLGTSFHEGDSVTFDGVPMTGVEVVNEQEIAGLTPPGVGGAADVKIQGTGGTVLAHDAFIYELTANPSQGGLAGGPITATLNVTVVDRLSRNGVDGAFVTVGNPATTSFKGVTDGFGHITFAAANMHGPVTVTASKPGYERGMFVAFDAAEATIFLMPIPPPVPPDPGPFPPGRQSGTISGSIMFGDVTGLGEPTWDLVPEPRGPHEVKRAMVFTTVSSPFSGSPFIGSGGIIDYQNDGRIAWDFQISARPAAQAVIAVAGLWNDSIDPDGDGPEPVGVFYPFAMGVARGVLVGPGEDVTNVTVIMDIPLDAALRVDLANPPPIAPGGLDGPDRYVARAYIDLGGEGVIVLPNHTRVFRPGETHAVLTAMPPLMTSISDASYTLITGAFTGEGGAPFSVRVERGLDGDAIAQPIVIDDFLGVPRAVDPAEGGALGLGGHLVWAPEGATTGQATFSYHTIQLAIDGTPLWRIFARGGLRDLPLFDLVTFGGMTPMPSPDSLVWTVYEIRIPALSFDDVNYGHINANLWSAYANDGYVVSLPP